MAARPPLALLSLFFLAGAILLMFLVLLAGTRDSNPLDQIYFLRADTSNIQGAPQMSRWTMWNVCETGPNGRNLCQNPVRAAYPLDPPREFGTTNHIPSEFVGTHKYYYMTRFMFAFFLIALFFAVLALFTGILALFSRLGGALSGLLTSIALFFFAIVASLMTAAYVLGRNHFRVNGRDAHVGTMAFGFVWAALACLFLSTILFFMILATKKRRDTTTTTPVRTTRRNRFFGRRRPARDRGSFIESESQRRVKDEYS
ncbi:MAG: hypothetical protein M1816_004039 [Peltula sp. TS41687]|nr:MAG: hypothetical protein M1816_004039 [Peltula sp. TS41687]